MDFVWHDLPICSFAFVVGVAAAAVDVDVICLYKIKIVQNELTDGDLNS